MKKVKNILIIQNAHIILLSTVSRDSVNTEIRSVVFRHKILLFLPIGNDPLTTININIKSGGIC